VLRWLAFLLALLLATPACAHPVPFSYLDLELRGQGLTGTLTVHQYDLAHEYEFADPAMAQDAHFLEDQQPEIVALFNGRIHLAAPRPLRLVWTGIKPLPERDAIQLSFRVPGPLGGKLTYSGDVFPYDPKHQTFVNVYDEGKLADQWITGAAGKPHTYYRGNGQGTAAVLRTFVPAGAHHIWIGPDHLLFLLGLLLFGGSWKRLLGIVTAFTVGHSITLSLAVLNIVALPSWLVEPAIALTIVVVGADNLMRGEGRDIRTVLAGIFGLIHGFGFATVLQEFGLPRGALGWSLFGFNFGVELGQLAVVLPLALVLGWLWRTRPRQARQIATAGSVVVIAGGAYWFLQRTIFSGGIL
jgi:hydrogenase/urease accessory protein HupE